MFIKKITAAAIAALTLSAGSSFADDTELYVYESSARAGARPQVLIIFDNSGSMDNKDYDAEASYDPSITYPASGSDNSLQERMLYFTKGGIDNTSLPVPDSPSESRRFLKEINGCETSWTYLERYGVFTGFFREYGFKGQSGTWQEVPDNNGANIEVIDCFDDIVDKKWRNAEGQPTGFPVDNLGNKQNPVLYTEIGGSSSDEEIQTAVDQAKKTGFGTGQTITLYTDNYLRWYHGDKEVEPKRRIDIAKEVIRNTIVTTPGVDFGLAVFNYDFPDEGDQDGGRIISGIQQMSESNKIALLSTVDELAPETNTPLCETLYEAKRYFAGESVLYAKENKNLKPGRDRSIENSGNYISPFKECQNQAFVVYITDGAPTLDRNADRRIKNLPGIDTTAFDWKIDGEKKYNFLPNLAEWMHTKDVNTNLPDQQSVKTFTIGFSNGADDAAPLLKETARLGGGQYFAAKNASQLQNALQQVFSDILKVNASFTSPSAAFDRTQTSDAVYYAMFLPNKGPRWAGNLKKFSVDGQGIVRDANGMDAIGSNGFISEKACSYWSDCSSANDGNDVKVGGAASRLQQNATRMLKSDLGTDGALEEFNQNNAEWVAGGSEQLAAYMGVTKEQVPILLQWARGENVDNDSNASSQNIRQDVMGDPLHSKPLPIKIGGKEYVFVGTNHGVMHMFDGQTGEEVWGFLPYQLLPNLRELRSNIPTGVHSVYGLDSPPVGYVHKDVTGEKVWIFFGMRRGGKSYYAMDVSDPQNPKLMWKVGPDSPGMSELAQTWAEPVVTKIPGWPAGNTDATKARPVLIFGAGYSPATKDSAAIGTNDTEGRGVFILDAATGDLVHSFGPATGSKMTEMPGITDSIPNAVAVLDSNSDGLTDRIYATDTGANVWRMDLPSTSPTSAEAPWSVFKFASLGGNVQIADRRFFAEPVVAQTMFSNITETRVTSEESGETSTRLSYQNVPYDAVVVGTGHRPHPTDLTRQDMFFTLQDRNVVTRSFGTAKNPIPEPLALDNLYRVSEAAPTTEAELITFGTKRGWYYSFGTEGEKNLAAAAIVFGRVYFTTYVPGDTSAANVCLAPGQGRFYGFDLHRGTRTFTQEYLEMGEQVPDTPQLVIPPGGDDNMYFIGIGNAGDLMNPVEPAKGCDPGDPRCIGGGMRANRIYYYTQ